MSAAATAYVSTSRLEPRSGQQKELVALLRRLAVAMYAEPGCVHYSVHRAIGDESGALMVVQVYSSIEAFQDHAVWMRAHVSELAALLAAPPAPPMLLEQVLLGGGEKEAFGR